MSEKGGGGGGGGGGGRRICTDITNQIHCKYLKTIKAHQTSIINTNIKFCHTVESKTQTLEVEGVSLYIILLCSLLQSVVL